MIPDNASPKTQAYKLMIDQLRGLHGAVTSQPDGLSPGEARKVRNRIAATHNNLLDRSPLDGLEIAKEEK